MTWRDALVAMFPALMLWGTLFALLYIRDRVVLGRAWNTPQAEKAEALIREWLSPAQLYDYEKRKKFQVTGSAAGRHLITPGHIRDLDTGQHICFVPENWRFLPVADVMLARKIALENDEVGALKVACRLAI